MKKSVMLAMMTILVISVFVNPISNSMIPGNSISLAKNLTGNYYKYDITVDAKSIFERGGEISFKGVPVGGNESFKNPARIPFLSSSINHTTKAGTRGNAFTANCIYVSISAEFMKSSNLLNKKALKLIIYEHGKWDKEYKSFDIILGQNVWDWTEDLPNKAPNSERVNNVDLAIAKTFVTRFEFPRAVIGGCNLFLKCETDGKGKKYEPGMQVFELWGISLGLEESSTKKYYKYDITVDANSTSERGGTITYKGVPIGGDQSPTNPVRIPYISSCTNHTTKAGTRGNAFTANCIYVSISAEYMKYANSLNKNVLRLEIYEHEKWSVLYKSFDIILGQNVWDWTEDLPNKAPNSERVDNKDANTRRTFVTRFEFPKAVIGGCNIFLTCETNGRNKNYEPGMQVFELWGITLGLE